MLECISIVAGHTMLLCNRDLCVCGGGGGLLP